MLSLLPESESAKLVVMVVMVMIIIVVMLVMVIMVKVKVYLDKKEANKALQRNTNKEEPKRLEWIPNKEHP